jgi:hypothetical protein
MKRLNKVFFGMATVLLAVVPCLAQPKGPTVTVKGEAVDLWCYMEGGDRGAAKKDCATACAKAGNPIGILDAKGNIYVAAGLEEHQPARDMLQQKMSDQVTATGTLVTKGGMKMLFIKSVQ